MVAIRAFVGIDIPDTSRDAIENFVSPLRDLDLDLRWVNRRQLHLTLNFLGGIAEENVNRVLDGMSQIASETVPFLVEFSSLGVFPNTKRPEVLWIGTDKGADALISLSEKVGQSLLERGFVTETRAFVPHLTVARIKSNRNSKALARRVEEKQVFGANGSFTAQRLTLYKSTLSKEGSLYEVIGQKKFGAC